MSTLARSPALWAWLALLGATLANWFAREDALPGIGAIILVVALFKVRLVMRYFMEVRDAPRALGWVMDGWLGVVGVSLMIQSFGMPGMGR